MDVDDVFYNPPERASGEESDADMDFELSPPKVTTDVDIGGGVEDAGFRPDESQDEDSTDPTIYTEPVSRVRIEVAISEMPLEERKDYVTVHSDIVEFVAGELAPSRGQMRYDVEFTEGRQEVVALNTLIALENGKAALSRYNQGFSLQDIEMDRLSHKRKRAPDEEYESEEGSASDHMDIDVDVEDELLGGLVLGAKSSRRSLRPRTSTRHSSRMPSGHSDDEDDDDEIQPMFSGRRLRSRPPKPQTINGTSLKSGLSSQDLDELANYPRPASDDESDGDFNLVYSDLVAPKGRPSKKSRHRSRRIQALNSRSRARSQTNSRQKSADSDIEFEAPRRSARSTRNKTNMQDDALMDDDSFYVADDKAPGVPKAISIREIFQPLPPDSPFASVHMDTCHTCGGSKLRGQLVHCQGCTLSYHKNCLGYRSARDHMVTKVGEDDFVLQCRFCIGLYVKRDGNAPRHSMCQDCKGDGRACAAFSEKKSSRQEEKLREQNDGIDPITPVSGELLNNADVVLFRCVTCHRGWHVEHLPGSDDVAVDTDLKLERLKDYAIDWQCDDCGSAKHKIHRLVAWRPTTTTAIEPRPLYTEVREDTKEYLIKWETTSYAHCTWMPGAWVYGLAPSAMRVSFGKRDAEQDLLKLTERDAIPDEYLMPDVILNVKMDRSVPRGKTKAAELESINHVTKIFVKFQGLGYDDVVWDTPPGKDMGEIHDAFTEAFYEYLEGKYFQHDPYSRIRERIKAFKASPFTEVDAQPKGLRRGKLMGYQLEGLNWLLENYHHGRSVVLADEMGLGKTVQVVALVTSLVQDSPKCWPFLIVVPNATCPNWRREFKQWAPDLRVVTYHGGREPQSLAYKYELFPDNSSEMKAHVVIMSYDSAQDPQTKTLFRHVNWTGLVVDEGQRLKNDQNLLYVALRSMKIPFRLLLTGTPLQNNKRELFNLIQFIDETQDAAELDEEYQVLDKETLPKLHDKIRPYFLRRTKAGVLKFLPPMAQIILPVTMTSIQEKLSKSIMAKNPELIKAMFSNSKMNKKERGSLNNILMQLRKCLCHPFMYSDAIEEKHHDPAVLHRNLVEASAKLMLMNIMLPRLKERGHRVLIFSQFLNQLDIIEDFLSGIGCEFRRLDGQIGSLEKQRRIDAFNAPDSPIFAFLLSTRAGGVGINLATADTVIIMDPDFNPHQDMQALSRAHRIGQKKKVLCFQLMTKDSVEERIMQVGRKKMALDHALIESMDDDDLAGDDLESILKHGAQALFSDDYQKEAIHYDAASVDKLLDRTEVEQTKTSEEGSAETQFSYARVWANEKTGFDDSLATEEEHEPLAINSGVWDRIIAQREAEAKREAEANREVLGRGGRRRQAINYKTNAIEGVPLGDIDAESSDSSDDFAGAASGDDSDDDMQNNSAKDAQQQLARLNQAPNAHNAKTGSLSKSDKVKLKASEGLKSSGKESKGYPAASDPKQELQESENGKQRRRRRRKNQDSGGPRRQTVPTQHSSRNSVTNQGIPANGQPEFSRYIKESYQRNAVALAGPHMVLLGRGVASFGSVRLPSEAQVRLALDEVHHSKAHATVKQHQKAALLSQLRDLSMQNGSRPR